ncbi:signal peptide peptidase SppA [Lysinibacillus pakistanensis]|uniref:Signal peptide peptidase SppA n=1 Tax=Lysinibacillus pakistanensis TaxID=759811 RepID=A0AAX3WRM8_9BACI|nr:signal peptide peptidase SppA [Lysinibacillus pakistanensis]MDM5229890.1 signal peptide peptidase SppA [Lysinibacillus pakistanensis]WHY45490.1 signal peptide peptidase SppA [Lysinibacillus pakistanensis]WHY50498.1 signal peptide peptidase SppA [Lysinibacillus pakistanensis]
MNVKRWTALIIAGVLLVFSLGINTVFAIFKSDLFGNFDSLMAGDNLSVMETVIENGNMDKRIAYLKIDGAIQDIGSSSLWQPVAYDHQFFLGQLDNILNDDSIQGIVLSVNSPGGGVKESAEIYKRLLKIKEEREIPIYVSMDSMAASGGYYISAPADKIFAQRDTITGSIGVIMQSINYQALAEKVGIKYETFKSGEHKDMLSPMREVTAEERAMMQDMINESYEEFVDIVEKGRNMSEAEVKKVADGRILSGTKALESGLIDEIGDQEATITALREDFDLQDAELFEYSYEMGGWQSYVGMKIGSVFGPSTEEKMLMKIMTDYKAPKMMYLYGEY